MEKQGTLQASLFGWLIEQVTNGFVAPIMPTTEGRSTSENAIGGKPRLTYSQNYFGPKARDSTRSE